MLQLKWQLPVLLLGMICLYALRSHSKSTLHDPFFSPDDRDFLAAPICSPMLESKEAIGIWGKIDYRIFSPSREKRNQTGYMTRWALFYYKAVLKESCASLKIQISHHLFLSPIIQWQASHPLNWLFSRQHFFPHPLLFLPRSFPQYIIFPSSVSYNNFMSKANMTSRIYIYKIHWSCMITVFLV